MIERALGLSLSFLAVLGIVALSAVAAALIIGSLRFFIRYLLRC